jgi:hypothetical protein
LIQIVTRKDGLTEIFDHREAVQAAPNEDWLYLYDAAGDICGMYFSANVLSVRVFDSEKAGEQNMTDENTDKARRTG